MSILWKPRASCFKRAADEIVEQRARVAELIAVAKGEGEGAAVIIHRHFKQQEACNILLA